MTTPMLIENGIYQPDGAAIAHVGQTAVLDLQIQAPDEESGPVVLVALDGRFFVQRVFARDGTLLVEVEPTRPDDYTVRFTLPVTDGLINPAKAADLTHAIVEILDGDVEDDIVRRPFSVRALRAGSPSALLSVGPAERLVVRYVGDTGLSAAQQVKDAGLIDTATGDALAAYLRAPAAAAAAELEPLIDEAEELIEETTGVIATAGAAQVSAVNTAGGTQVAAVHTAGGTQVAAVNAAGGTQVAAVNTAGGTQVGAVNTAGGVQVSAVNTAGATQVTAVNAAGTAQTALVIDAAHDASYFADTYPNSAQAAVPRGVTAVVLTAPGTGYTNALGYVGTVIGGAGTGARFLFDVVLGAVGNIRGIEPGYGYSGNPTGADFSAAGGGNGATATVTASHLVLSGEFYWAAEASGATFRRYQNLAGVPTPTNLYRSYSAQVPCTATASSSILHNLTPESGFPVIGLGQKFRCIAPGTSGAGVYRAKVIGLYGDAYVDVLLPDGTPAPQGAVKGNYPAEFTPAVIGGTNYLILTAPAWQQQMSGLHAIATGTVGAPILTLTSPAAKYPGDFQVDLEFDAIFDANGNGVTASVRDSTGATILGTLIIRDRDALTTPPAGRWLAGDRVRIRRTAGGIGRLISVSSRTATPVEAAAGLDDQRFMTPLTTEAHFAGKRGGLGRFDVASRIQIPSVLRPIKLTAPEDHRILMEMLPPLSAYRNGRPRRYDDRVLFEMTNLAAKYVPGLGFKHLWVLTSIWTQFRGDLVQHVNYSFDAPVASSVNTGATPSQFEPFYAGGKPGDVLLSDPPNPATDINHPGSGPFHGRTNPTGLSLGITGGVRNGIVLADGTNVRDTLKAGDVIECAQVDFSSSWLYLTPDGSTLATITGLHRFAPLLSQQCLMNFSAAFAADRVVSFGYPQMFPNRLANKVQATLMDGSLGPVLDCGAGLGATIPLGQARTLTTWNSEKADHRIEAVVNPAYAPFRRNGAAVPYTLDAFGVDGSSGFKGYWGSHTNSMDTDAEGGNTLSSHVTYGGVFTQ